MGLDVLNMVGVDTGLVDGFTNQHRLLLGVGHVVAAGMTTVIDRAGLDHPMNAITVEQRGRQGLEDQCANPFAGYVAVAALGKTTATPVH
ncbi:hypothetical protein D3C78_1374000 [compost metagenome]